MLTLYYKPSCPFSQKILDFGEKNNIEFELQNISANPALAAVLVEKGGKHQVPFLVDTEQKISMYESDDIIEYLSANYNG